jgi:hypothetical protein
MGIVASVGTELMLTEYVFPKSEALTESKVKKLPVTSVVKS